MSRNAIISPHFEQRELLITSTNTTCPPIGKCTIGRALRKSYALKVTDVWKNDGPLRSKSRTSFWNMKFSQCLPRAGTQSPAQALE